MRQHKNTECAAHAVENACLSLGLKVPVLDFTIANEHGTWIDWQLEFVERENILVADSYRLFTKMDNLSCVLEPAIMLLVAHPSSHSVAIIANTARNQNVEFIFNHWVCFCIRHISGVIQPVEYYDSRVLARHGCEEMANLLFRYASQNYARFTFDGRCKELADFMTGTLMSQDVDALLPLQVPPTSSDSINIGAYADILQGLQIPIRSDSTSIGAYADALQCLRIPPVESR